ncbi:ABC transporter permease [Streptomyces sp. R39]|uniref:ABC transporter permease n=1 Tax=Streptomyces sp. R39 TaxID=3238631 RepID=A0AB39QZL7_9ACTN
MSDTEIVVPPTPAAGQPARGGTAWTQRLRTLPASTAVGVFLLLTALAFSLASDQFLTSGNTTTIVATASVTMLAALGQLLVVISGGFDLSIGGVVPLAAVVFAKTAGAGAGPVQAVLAALAVGVLVGLVHTVFIVKLGINPLITTLATMSVAAGVAFTVADGQTVPVPASAGGLGDAFLGTLPWHVLLTAAAVGLLHIVLRHTLFGRRLYMVGGNPEAARLAGVRTILIGASVYILSGVLAALAGVVLASQVLAASGGIGTDVTMQSLAAIVLGGAALTGGRGSVVGAVFGVLLLGVIADGMSILLVPSFYQQIVTGLVLLAAVSLSRFQERSRSAG